MRFHKLVREKKLTIDDGKSGNKKSKKEEAPISVVEEGKRDVVNEAFRVIRSNIEFMSGKETSGQVIMLTSFNPEVVNLLYHTI